MYVYLSESSRCLLGVVACCLFLQLAKPTRLHLFRLPLWCTVACERSTRGGRAAATATLQERRMEHSRSCCTTDGNSHCSHKHDHDRVSLPPRREQRHSRRSRLQAIRWWWSRCTTNPSVATTTSSPAIAMRQLACGLEEGRPLGSRASELTPGTLQA